MIFKQSIDLYDKKKILREVKEVWVETTVQEKNITFPTDRKLTEKVIEHCKRIAFKIFHDFVKQLNLIPKSYMKEFDVL